MENNKRKLLECFTNNLKATSLKFKDNIRKNVFKRSKVKGKIK